MAESGSKTTIVVALISLVGVLGAAVIANWDKLTANVTSQPQVTPSESPPVSAPKDVSPQQAVTRPPEDALLGHWISTFDNPLFSVIDISREGSELHVLAYVNSRGPDKGGCVYDAILDGKRGVVAKGNTVGWQLPTLPLPCANWVQPGFTGASILIAIADDSPDTLATVVNMYAAQQLMAGSGPQKYIRK
ncbi:hypothetical protein [Ralstonia pseudosolanacearum]|uniref:hypothetical protein n=1 Tax=Ralstonia pseudosolanacearum TaxID=1310165 RepID=UPI0026752A1D|nr:hypothetical protein [Ralstonia pseudosolanacearum]MDO3524487.1 hypothetical protein [Ralstonia pseudosolanacearum]MDO3552387.1 hypothetical protein [Ralstonia pseudosolanacearum]MDO3591208.1 hypothetical protein [Ralstonia pseudosolanacearum]MDO3595698.1 hypothetical protein [Ralstonia pseudosolanacearum]MDO3601295.1 hypothetical protein [Ralstonia pseudosolanacearum]